MVRLVGCFQLRINCLEEVPFLTQTSAHHLNATNWPWKEAQD